MNGIEAEFANLYKYIDGMSEHDLVVVISENFNRMDLSRKIDFVALKERYTFLKHYINVSSGDYSLIVEYVSLLKRRLPEFAKLFYRFADYKSKFVLLSLMRYWINFDIQPLYKALELNFEPYWDFDILGSLNDCTYVDCGAFDGDSVNSFAKSFPDYSKIYAFEMTPQTFRKMNDNTASLRDIIRINKAVGKDEADISISSKGGAGNSVYVTGDVKVNMTSLDKEIAEPLTMIKMDIEGAEKDAIEGSRRHILDEKPVILACAYHLSGDILDIPELIEGIRDDYSYYLRFYGYGCLWPCDYVIFAV